MITTVYVKHELLFSLLTQTVKVVLHLIAFLKSFFLLKYLTGRVLLGRMVLIKKLLKRNYFPPTPKSNHWSRFRHKYSLHALQPAFMAHFRIFLITKLVNNG